MTKVLYITAWGRSGTTILDNILNSYPTVFSAGELVYLWRRGLSQNRRCGCGQRFPDCRLWQRIRQVAYGDRQPDPRDVTRLQDTVARTRYARRLLTREAGPEVRGYRDLMARLYRAIGEVTGSELVIDSSKSPAGAAVLARLDGVEPYLLHMVRDPRAVAHSWMRPTPQLDRSEPVLMEQHGPWESSSRWLIWNMLAERMAAAYPGRFRRLRYEDLVARPRAMVEDLLALTATSVEGGPFQDDRTVELAGNHTVSGNPGRFRTGRTVLRPDEAWRNDQPFIPRAVATVVALPLLHRYGYRMR